MSCLLDTGILLRLCDHGDPQHAIVQTAVETLRMRREDIFTAVQNLAEFWNVATRPTSANGLGLSVLKAIELLETVIEPTCALVFERAHGYSELKRLAGAYAFQGKQVHDARLVAVMLDWQIEKILTLNIRDFRRYASEGIVVLTPDSLV